MELNRSQLAALLLMTPHTMRIRPENRARIENLPSLSLTVEYYVRVLEKSKKAHILHT